MSDRTRAKLERKRRQAFLEAYYGLAIQIALYVLAFFAILHRFNFLHSHILYGINRGFAWTFAMFSGIGMIIWLPMMAFAGSMRNTMRSMSTEDLAVERQSVIMGALYILAGFTRPGTILLSCCGLCIGLTYAIRRTPHEVL